MKKTMKKITQVMVAMFGLSVVPGAHAQDNAALLQELADANKDYVSQAFEYDSSLYMEVDGQKYVDIASKGNGKYNVENPFSGEVTFDVNGEVSQNTPQAPIVEEGSESTEEATTVATSEVQLEPLSFATTVIVLDNIAYTLDGDTWKSKDVTEDLKEMSKSFDEMKASIKPEQVKALQEKLAPYMDVTETDSEYVVKLKQDIDSKQFWTDLNEVLDIEKMKASAIEEAEKQAQSQGVEFTDAQRQQTEYFIDKGLEFFLDMISYSESHYDKESKKLTQSIIDIDLTEEDIANIVGMDKEALGVTANVKIAIKINFSNHGETFDIKAPEDAQPAESEAGSESSEESGASEESQASEETAEDDATIEETTAA